MVYKLYELSYEDVMVIDKNKNSRITKSTGVFGE